MAKKATVTLEQATDSVCSWMYSDSRVQMDRQQVEAALKEDFENVGRYPTDAECEELVTGGDEGEPSEELQSTFSQTNEVIKAVFE